MSQQPYVQLATLDAKPETPETAGQPPAQAATVPSQKQSATTDQQLVAVPQSQMFCQVGTNSGQPQMFYGHTPPQPGMQLFVQPAPQAIACVPVSGYVPSIVASKSALDSYLGKCMNLQLLYFVQREILHWITIRVWIYDLW